jgi:hypothetical protein
VTEKPIAMSNPAAKSFRDAGLVFSTAFFSLRILKVVSAR